ncbi:MAG: hypothetical protein ACHQX1_03165 [Candidatus Micrarchaeales archaeon]
MVDSTKIFNSKKSIGGILQDLERASNNFIAALRVEMEIRKKHTNEELGLPYHRVTIENLQRK